MKTYFTTFALSLALGAAAGATAQIRSAAPAPATDTVMLSETTNGDYTVRRFVIKSHDNSDYTIRYRINMATLNATLSGNAKELDGLNAFVGNLMKDTLMQATTVTITGYSSPDGPVAFNKALAAKRANDFKAYVDRKYGFSKKYKVTLTSVAEDWAMCRTLVAQATMPDKQAVLNVIDSKQSADAKEVALKKMPEAWEYMTKNILPPLRRVEMTINYGVGRIIEVRTLIQKPKPAPAPTPAPTAPPKTAACDSCPCEVVDESITGIIVAMPETEAEYRREAREVDKAAKYEAREAEKIVRDEMKAARKIAKKEAKAAKKAEKAARKVARKAAKM